MERIWLKSYPPNISPDIDLSLFSSVVNMFDQCCVNFKSKPAYQFQDHVITYHDLELLSKAFAAFLQNKLHLEKGSRVAIMLPNSLQYPIAMFGILRAGMIVVNINPFFTVPELTKILDSTGAETIIAISSSLPLLKQTLPHTKIKHIIITDLNDLLDKKSIVNFIRLYIKKISLKRLSQYVFTFNEVLSTGKNLRFKDVALTIDDTAFLQSTSGTTGVSKYVILTHKNLLSNILGSVAWYQPILSDQRDEIVITAMPFYHVLALITNCMTFMLLGGLNILISNPRDIDYLIEEIKDKEFTAIIGVNTFFKSLLNHPDFTKINFSRLHITIAGGMTLEETAVNKWIKVTGCNVINQYGQTETGPIVINRMDSKTYADWVGLPLPSVEVSIRNDENKEINLGEIGELCVRGYSVTPGYWNNTDETSRAFTPDGWLRTGDLFRQDSHGYLYFIARKKEIIKVSGFTVSPVEIEKVIAKHPGVHEVVVIGMPDDHAGEVPKAVIVKKDPALSAEDVIAFCRQSLTGYKIPRTIEFRTELPKSYMGKILKRNI